MKRLLTISAAIEGGTSIVLAAAPSSAVELLLGSPLESPSELVISRILAASLFALAAACWLARSDALGRAAVGLIAAMFTYNIAVATIVGYAGLAGGMSGIGMVPAVVLHCAMAVWCAVCLLLWTVAVPPHPAFGRPLPGGRGGQGASAPE
jgi:hypothetical protein